MICIAIAQKSRSLALVDLINAAPQCDLVEIRLDCFEDGPDIKELLAHKRKPAILTCRRAEDGGDWLGQEEARIALLRQCVEAGADYVELELDIADRVPAGSATKRVISYTNLVETPENLAEIYQAAQAKSPDVIKLVVPARSPEEVWPVVQVLVRPAVPTVVVGVGKPGIMLALLARKVGAPWVYASLEQGMEAYHDQASVRELEEIYHYRAVGRGTPFAVVTGFGEQQYVNVAMLNGAFAHLGEAVRCLPMEIGQSELFRKVLGAVKAHSAVIDPAHQGSVREVVVELKPSAQAAEAVDFLNLEEGRWLGYNLFGRSVLAALEETLRAGGRGNSAFQGLKVLFLGTNGLARVLAATVQKGGATAIIAGTSPSATSALAETLGCQGVSDEGVAATPHDVLVRCDATPLEASALRPGTTLVDLTALPRWSPLLTAAGAQGHPVVTPRQILVELVNRQARAVVGKTVPREVLVGVLDPLIAEG